MSRPMLREGSSVPQFRRRVPSDILEVARGKLVLIDLPASKGDPAITVASKVGQFVKFSLRSYDPDVVKFRQAAANTQLERQFHTWRSGPATISHMQAVALAGEIYRLNVERFQHNPGPREGWAAFKAFNRAAKEGRLLNPPQLDFDALPDSNKATAVFGQNLTEGVNAHPSVVENQFQALEARFGLLANWVLQRHGLLIDMESRSTLLRCIADAATDAAWDLKRKADGDYTPDPRAARFPPISVVAKPVSSISLSELFDKWAAETRPSASTKSTWTSNLRNFQDNLDRKADDIRSIAPEDVVAWKDAAIARGLAAKTINASYLGMAKTIFNYAVSNKLLAENPADDVRVTAKTKAGSGALPHTDDEVAQLLVLASKEKDPSRRWLPWLAASSGARIGEVAQLWGSRVRSENGIPVMIIAPAEDGGSIKNEGSERTVPIHPALVAAGFLDFVKSKGDGPLFYRRSSGKADSRHASKGVTNRLSDWVRKIGFTDPRKAPNHALRHYFKSAAVRAGISDGLADAIQGHSVKTDAGRYRHFDIATKAEAIGRLVMPPKSKGL